MYTLVLLKGSHPPVQRLPSCIIVSFTRRRSHSELLRARRENMARYFPGNGLYPSSGSGSNIGLGSQIFWYSNGDARDRSKRPNLRPALWRRLSREKYVGSVFVKYSPFCNRIRNIRAQEANISKKNIAPTTATEINSAFLFFE